MNKKPVTKKCPCGNMVKVDGRKKSQRRVYCSKTCEKIYTGSLEELGVSTYYKLSSKNDKSWTVIFDPGPYGLQIGAMVANIDVTLKDGHFNCGTVLTRDGHVYVVVTRKNSGCQGLVDISGVLKQHINLITENADLLARRS